MRALRYFPPNQPKQRGHRLFLRPLVRRRRLAAMLVRLLLVAVVIELVLANRLLDFFLRHGGWGLALGAS